MTTTQTAAEIKAIPVRHWGRWIAAAVLLSAVGFLAYGLASSSEIDWSVVTRYLFNPVVLEGVVNTLWISVAAMAIGIALGVGVGVMRLSRNPVLTSASWVYIWFFRGTPVLVQLYFWYYGVPLVWQNLKLSIPFTSVVLFQFPMKDVLTPAIAALVGLGLNEGAYMAEIVRAGILSVDRGQVEAAQALGMGPTLAMRRVVLPQAMRVIIPPTGNEFISLLKTSSLAASIQFLEVFKVVQDTYSVNQRVFEMLVVASIWYLVLTSVFSVGQFFLERRYGRGTNQLSGEGLLARIGKNLLPRSPAERRRVGGAAKLSDKGPGG